MMANQRDSCSIATPDDVSPVFSPLGVPMHAHRSRHLGLVAVGLPVMLAAAPLVADDIPIITIDAAGPSREIPTDKSFYLAGDAEQAAFVQAFVVRTGSPSIFGDELGIDSPRKPCRDLFADLEGQGFRTAPDGSPSPTWTGSLVASDVWKTDHRWQVRASGVWKAANDTTAFKVLVQHDGEFFAAGYRYCVAVYRARVKKTSNPVIAQQVLAVADPTTCRTQAAAAETACAAGGPVTAGCRVAWKQAYDQCDAGQLGALSAAIGALPAAQRADITAAVTASIGSARSVVTHVATVEAMAQQWSGAVAPPVLQPLYIAVPISRKGKATLAAHPLGAVVLALLAHHGHVVPVMDPDVPGVIRTMTRDAKLEIRGVGILGDGSLVAFNDPTGADQQKLGIKVGDLAIPGTELSLADVLAFSRGELPFEGQWLGPAAFEARLAVAVRRTHDQVELGDQLAVLERVAARLTKVAEGIRALDQAPAAGVIYPATPAAIRRDLGAWLKAGIQRPCTTAQLAAWRLDAAGCPGGTEWPSYAAARGPLVELARAIELWARDYPAWLATRPLLVASTTEIKAVADPVDVKLEYTQRTWFFSYVSPVVGYSVALSARDPFALRYYGLQVHLRPNPGNDWIASAGLKGGLALELGLAPATGPFESAPRFRGLFGIGGIHVGGVIHPVPFTSVSVGALLMERRSSTVTEERFAPYASLYVGLSVDVNLPALIKGSFSTTTAIKN